MANEHLLSIRGPTKNVEFTVNLDDFDPDRELTDSEIAEGRYALQIQPGTCEVVEPAAQGKTGRNFRCSMRIVGPDCAELNKKVVVTHPIPIGDLRDADVRKNAFYFLALLTYVVYGKARAKGVPEDRLKETLHEALVGETQKRTDYFDNAVVHGYITLGTRPDAKGRLWPGIKYYISKTDFDASPGPVHHTEIAVQGVKVASDAPRSSSATLTAPPNAQSPVAAMLGLGTPTTATPPRSNGLDL